MGTWAVLLILISGVVCGFVAQAVGTPRYRYDWLITAIGAGLGALAGGLYLEAWTTWGPSFDGLYVLPALLGAVFVGGLFEILIRLTAPLTPPTRQRAGGAASEPPTSYWSPD